MRKKEGRTLKNNYQTSKMKINSFTWPRFAVISIKKKPQPCQGYGPVTVEHEIPFSH
jgi:hypothetical protein